jgi:hypothetical protein
MNNAVKKRAFVSAIVLAAILHAGLIAYAQSSVVTAPVPFGMPMGSPSLMR